MTSAITVRWVTSESWAVVKKAAWQVLHDAGLGTAEFSFLRRRYTSNREGMAIAETRTGEVVGIVTISVEPEGYNAQYGLPGPRAFVDEIGVVPSARSAGVGRLLMCAAAQEVRRRGGLRFALDVDQSSDETTRRPFFASCGLTSLRPDRDDDILGASVDEVLAATCKGTVD